MSEQNPVNNEENSEENAPQDNSMAAFSPLMKELEEALNILYIKSNASGRNKFRDKWPFVSQYLFGDTLIDYDNHGTQDREHRAELEERADERRILLKTTISEAVNKSVDAGMLNFEYVGKVIDTFGAELSKFLYAENIIERVRPGLLTQTSQQPETTQKTNIRPTESENISPNHGQESSVPTPTSQPANTIEEDIQLRTQEKEILKNQSPMDDEMDNIKPIDTGDLPTQTEQPLQEGAPAPTETNNEFSIPETLETPVEHQNSMAENQAPVKNSEPATSGAEKNIPPTPPPIDKTEEKTEQPQHSEMHIPDTLSKPEQTEKTHTEPAPAQEQPHDKGQCTLLFNDLANKMAA